ncbi:MAG TPA: hypothetical protein VJH92_03960 [Candidatus Nanoarchaeia archaeon]|nr:hypothetical protein [Candidatus Nanoarchaeia archaeon]
MGGLRKYLLHIYAAIILLIITIKSWLSLSIPWWALIALAVVYVAITFIKDIKSESKESRLFGRIRELTTKYENESERNKEIDRKLSETQNILHKLTSEKETSIHLLTQLLNKGLIDEEDINRHLESAELTSVFVYATPLPQVKEKKQKLKGFRRLYPGFFEQDIGFIRMGRVAPFFVILSDNLPKELRDTRTLKAYLLSKIDFLLKEEWDLFLDELKKQSFKKNLKKYEKEKYSDHLKLSILILKGKISENNLGFLHEQTFYKRFYDLIRLNIDFAKIDLPTFKKTKVKNFILDSSFELLFYGVPSEDLKKLEEVEPKLKKNLNILNLTDYANKSEQDIAEILKEKFSSNTAVEYSKRLCKKAKEYDKALRKLGIGLD